MSDDPDEGLAEGTLVSHLLELRDRLLKALLAVGICFIPCAIYMNALFTFVALWTGSFWGRPTWGA